MSNRLLKTEEEVRQRVKELLKLQPEDLITKYMFQEQEIERLQNIIKEVREYIENNVIQNDITNQDYKEKYKELLDILDKESK